MYRLVSGGNAEQVYDNTRIKGQVLIASGTRRLLVPCNRTKWDETVYLTNHLHSGSGGQVQMQLELTQPLQVLSMGALRTHDLSRPQIAADFAAPGTQLPCPISSDPVPAVKTSDNLSYAGIQVTLAGP